MTTPSKPRMPEYWPETDGKSWFVMSSGRQYVDCGIFKLQHHAEAVCKALTDAAFAGLQVGEAEIKDAHAARLRTKTLPDGWFAVPPAMIDAVEALLKNGPTLRESLARMYDRQMETHVAEKRRPLVGDGRCAGQGGAE